MTNNIVTVNVSQTVAPAPSTLQRTGAFISQGGTNTAANTLSLLTQISDLTALQTGLTKAITTLAWSGSVVTVTTSAPHGWTIGQTFPVTIAGAAPTGYNGTYTGTVTGASTFTYPLVANPGAQVTPGTAVQGDVAELLAMATTFFTQGSACSVYVLELGAGQGVSAGVTALSAYLTANPGSLYSLLVPRSWDNDTGFKALLANYEATTSRLYFFITTTLGTYSNYTDLTKCAFTMIEATGIPVTEFSLAAAFYVTLNYSPSSTNQVTPTAFAYLFGVTAYPTVGNAATLALLQAAYVNVVATGAEGGISNTILKWGTLEDGNDFTYWYSVDWVQIEIDLDLSNEIINGSNNPLAPLYYNQQGIDRLQLRAQDTMNRGISFGLVLSPVTVLAETFAAWIAANESSYATGFYGGLSVTYTPSRGFKTITFDVNVSNFPAA